jgi:hypothetical protein
LKERARAFETLGAIKLEVIPYMELLKSIQKQIVARGFEASGLMKGAPSPQSFRLRVRVRPPVAPSTKAACIVRAAFASTQSCERERAFPVSMPSANPENAEL